MINEHHCCCSSNNKTNPAEENRLGLNRFALVFRWVARGAALYFILLIAAQWIMFFSSPIPNMDYRWGLLSTAAYVVLGALSWAVSTALSLALQRLAMLPVKQEAGETK
ncbi:MAG TPA: hypothetical protein PLL10_04015 [Elusimicrobiales bacterium]|nr:hypothetical protein [Elusimicrobiales bacterium]